MLGQVARIDEASEHRGHLLVDRADMALHEPVHPRSVALALLRDDAMQLRMRRRKGDELAHEQFCHGELVDTAQAVDARGQRLIISANSPSTAARHRASLELKW